MRSAVRSWRHGYKPSMQDAQKGADETAPFAFFGRKYGSIPREEKNSGCFVAAVLERMII